MIRRASRWRRVQLRDCCSVRNRTIPCVSSLDMTDIPIRAVPDDAIAAPDANAQRAGSVLNLLVDMAMDRAYCLVKRVARRTSKRRSSI